MKKKYIIIKTIILLILLNSYGLSAKLSFFEEGKIFFDKKEFDKSKFFLKKILYLIPRMKNPIYT